ncbi:MAG: ABC transporter substrate-binding protein [Lachnospiraceae bacterium]|nr:ABC transporter substrate-binding protein [Lachnospiraceae bacterium]
MKKRSIKPEKGLWIWASKAFLLLFLLFVPCACGQATGDGSSVSSEGAGEGVKGTSASDAQAPRFDQMIWEQGMELSYSTRFCVEKSGEYALITIAGEDRYLLIPSDAKAPVEVPKEITILQKPLDHVYLCSSSVFDLICEINAMENLVFSGTKKEDLCIQEAVEAMENGSLLYAGKYNKPDYELLIGKQCDLAIENTMIYHNPETKEKLEALGIPVLVEASSYEEHPFGRMEWIKLYGLLFDHLEEANAFFEESVNKLGPLLQQEKTNLRVAFFYVNGNGAINVRKPGDYVAKMIELAGGEYVLSTLEEQEENALSTMNMQLEDFYLAAKDADIIIYNGTTVGTLESIGQLLALSPVFADFKAVKNGRVYSTTQNFFQETTAIADFVEELGRILRDQDATGFSQLIKVRE